MREIDVREVTRAVKEAAIAANYDLGADILAALARGEEAEESPAGREVFRQLLINARIAAQERIPLCQDCGVAVVFVELGQVSVLPMVVDEQTGEAGYQTRLEAFVEMLRIKREKQYGNKPIEKITWNEFNYDQ